MISTSTPTSPHAHKDDRKPKSQEEKHVMLRSSLCSLFSSPPNRQSPPFIPPSLPFLHHQQLYLASIRQGGGGTSLYALPSHPSASIRVRLHHATTAAPAAQAERGRKEKKPITNTHLHTHRDPQKVSQPSSLRIVYSMYMYMYPHTSSPDRTKKGKKKKPKTGILHLPGYNSLSRISLPKSPLLGGGETQGARICKG